MSTTELDSARFPNLAGEERPFYDFWAEHIVREGDPHRDKWTEYEEGAIERAEERNDLIRSVTDIEGKSVLDVGCQNGAWLVALGRAGAQPTGIDVVPLAVEAAGVRTQACGVEAKLEVGSAGEMPFGTGEFDIVATSDVLEHVPDKIAMIHECVRVLRPGGLLFLAAPVRFSIKHLAHDPHYGHPIVSVLPGSVARWVTTRWMGESEYEVETLPTRAWVDRQLRRYGMQPIEVDERFTGRSVPGPRAIKAIVDELRQGFVIVSKKPAT